ncbi:tetratricopeptide repeat protein [Flavicella sp.]|uniref:type IX secretion system periplasmic lipoprotein PorW/SprE n=1 Tax=Flavicella sp. TaxID=2957742 RepID=UPI0026284F1C|nr:tetratricopeptide repeat protein [Flavicella sp.]MDG1805084.1 tetratricopeptide repeat protein [Flavicella sp.]
MVKNYSFLFIGLALLVFSCSTKKDTFVNRKYHAMTTEYNILYNGEIAFQAGLNEINEKYQDNYWEILPIEPLNVDEGKIDIPDYKKKSKKSNKNKKKKEVDKNLTSFELAEEKAVKAVQKHSMNIGGKEKNSRIDEAYLLLGKSRYYTSRFVPAMEAFNYVIKNYPEASLIDETIVWKAKADIRMQNEDVAIADLEEFLEKDQIDQANLEDAYITMAMAYTQIDSTEMIIRSLHSAVDESKNPTKKARNLFILGQLYREENDLNNSQTAFQEIIDFRKAPYDYKVHAEIEKVKNFQLGGVPEEAIPQLEKLIKIRENRPYLDELYYHLALLQNKNGDQDIALENYQNSVHAKNAKNFQKGLSYEASGDIYFDDTDYATASSFYDSVLQVSGNIDSKRIRKLKRKKQGLESVLVFEEVIRRNDSIWNVLAMDKEEQFEYFTAYIENLKREEQEAKEKAEFLEDLKKYEETGLASAQTPVKASHKNGDWYFYSSQTVSFGSQEFKRIWGSRKLTDNWRWSDNTRLRDEELIVVSTAAAEGGDELPEKYKVDYYVNQLPSTLNEIDSISNLRSSTYYQLGLIYKEQFKEYELAAETLETLIEIFPEDKLVLGTNYHLFRIYEAMGNQEKADYYSGIVVRRFPNSVFAQMIINPDEVIDSTSDKTPEGSYREIYYTYKSGDYLQTIYDISKALRTFEGTPIVPKLELLKAYALAKTKGKKAFMNALDYIVLNYSNTEEGKKAKELMSKLK